VTTRDNIARITGLQGRYTEAEQLFSRVLTHRRQSIGEEHPHTLTTRHRLARVIADQGRHKEAEQPFGRILNDRAHILGHQHSTLTPRRPAPARTDHHLTSSR
jgi:hypothetical protein